MSEVKIFQVPNKLRDKILKKGGARVEESLAKADKALVAMRAPALAHIEGLIDQIVQIYGRASRNGDEAFLPLYMLSSQIIDSSAPLKDLEIDRAAFHMCELVDRCMGLGRWDWPSVDVHIDALQLLRLDQGKLPAAARAQIFLGLKQVYDRLPKPEIQLEPAAALDEGLELDADGAASAAAI